MAKARKRRVWRVQWLARIVGGKKLMMWCIVWPDGVRTGALRSGDRTKLGVLAEARGYARESWQTFKRTSQLVVHKRDGTFQFEHTYGKDPRRSRG